MTFKTEMSQSWKWFLHHSFQIFQFGVIDIPEVDSGNAVSVFGGSNINSVFYILVAQRIQGIVDYDDREGWPQIHCSRGCGVSADNLQLQTPR